MKPKDFFPRPDVKIAWRRWDTTPALRTLVPFKLGNGFQLEELTVTCPNCTNEGPHEHMRGELESNGLGGFKIRTVMWCQACNLLSYTRGEIVPNGKTCRIYKDETPPYWSPWGEDNASIRGGFGR